MSPAHDSIRNFTVEKWVVHWQTTFKGNKMSKFVHNVWATGNFCTSEKFPFIHFVSRSETKWMKWNFVLSYKASAHVHICYGRPCKKKWPISGKVERSENGSNDFLETWYAPSFGYGLSFGGVVDPMKTHYDVIIGGQKWGQNFPAVQYGLMIHQSKGFFKSSSNLISYWCYDVITWRHRLLKIDF